jgi:hypothetical protein
MVDIEEYSELVELFSDISRWVKLSSDPNSDHRYHRCIVCNATWWDDGLFSVEKHNFGCWVPRLQNTMQQVRQDNG